MAPGPLNVAILWHHHQPCYWDPVVEWYRYPWAFLHGARHYHMMAKVAERHPGARVNFNITPVLVEQLDHYSGATIHDRILELILKPAPDLDPVERAHFLDHVFRLNIPTMIGPYPRFRDLHGRYTRDPWADFSDAELRDLQTWYLLTWCGMPLRSEDPVRSLLAKGANFTEADKQVVFEAMRRVVAEVVPLYRRLAAAGQIEISTTPYYHPILPLLIDTEMARTSRPEVDLGEVDFRYPEDAKWHVEEAIRSHRQHFGEKPRGMWPAEGGVSDAALHLMADHGILWAATDEDVLGRSMSNFALPPEARYRPYRFAGRDLFILFRDRGLSDRIGFIYSQWRGDHAADDLVKHLLSIRRMLGSHASECVVPIILDGENPWEYYPDHGQGFLDSLYHRLETNPDLRAVRIGDLARDATNAPHVDHVVPGSWIYANFDTWIGCPEKNRAWVLLANARRRITLEAPDASIPLVVYRAEGSDWFWWLGPGHDTPFEGSYEDLFRSNLRKGLEQCEIEVPTMLEMPAPISAEPAFVEPTHLFTPPINGRLGSYYDWISGGCVRAMNGATHWMDRPLERIRFGFDEANLYLRVEGNAIRTGRVGPQGVVRIQFHRPRKATLYYGGGKVRLETDDGGEVATQARAAMETVFELGIPVEEISAHPGDWIEFSVEASVNGDTVDRLPTLGTTTVRVPEPDFGQENWSP